MTEHAHSQVISPENPTTEQKSPEANGQATNVEALTFETNEFVDGDYKGFKYTVPVHNITGRKTTLTVDEGVAKAIERYGEATVLLLMDSQILGRIRTKVKNGLPKNQKPAELAAEHAKLLQKHPDGMLFSAEEATNWKPEMRELSPNQLYKKAKEAFQQAGTETDPNKRAELLVLGQKYLMDMGTALQS